MDRTRAGITSKFENPGYKEFEICPVIGGTLNYAEASYESLYGTIYSRWEKIKEGVLYKCSIPTNTRAKIVFPNGRKVTVGSGEYEFQL